MKYIILVFVILHAVTMCGQGEFDNWYFGFGAGVHFNSNGSINALNDGQLHSYEGCSTISDTKGNLLFYSEGTTVYDRDHSIMQNGTGLYGDASSTQSALIIPKPDDPSIYYIFTVDTNSDSVPDRGLNYSVVDMSLNNGNGAIIEKNLNLLPNSTEKITWAIKGCSEGALWIITLAPENGNSGLFNTYHAFEVNSTGVVATAVRSTFNNLQITDDRGYLKTTLDGTKLASANAGSGLYLYNFNANTGYLTQQQEISISAISNDQPYGIEFSPSGQMLYVNASNNIYSLSGQTSALLQYDLLATDISNSEVILDDRALFRGALQLGPNGKIYRALSENYIEGNSYLGVINNPDEKGLAANYQHNAVSLGENKAAQGLPPLVPTFSKDLPITQNGPLCVGDSLALETPYLPGATYAWQKEGITLPNAHSHQFQKAAAGTSDAGQYSVTIIRPNAGECPVIAETEVQIYERPEAMDQTLLLCDMDTDNPSDGIAAFNLLAVETEPEVLYVYYETKADRELDSAIANPENYRNQQPFEQTIYYKVINSAGCESNGDIQLLIKTLPTVTLEEAYVLCMNNPNLSLSAPVGFDTYAWLKVEGDIEFLISSDPTVEIFETGNYVLETVRVYSENSETIRCDQSIDFQVLPSSTVVIWEVRIAHPMGQNTLEVIVDGDGTYEFSMDGSTYQDSNNFENMPKGTVTISVRDKNGCGFAEETVEINPMLTTGKFPKFFTPNGDGINDYWQFIPPSENSDIDIETIYIFNRHGLLLSQIDPKSQGWDGRLNGHPAVATDYWFRAVSYKNLEVNGHFSLKR